MIKIFILKGCKFVYNYFLNQRVEYHKSKREKSTKKQQERELDKKKKGEENWKKKNLELAEKHKKISNQMKNRNHKLSRKLVNKFNLIAYENLKVKEITERKENKERKINRLVKGIIRASWYQQSLFYKEKEASKEVIFFDQKNTTQRCSNCVKLDNPKIKKDVKIYNCSCGLVLDRDVNAAKNILYLAQNNRLGTLFFEMV